MTPATLLLGSLVIAVAYLAAVGVSALMSALYTGGRREDRTEGTDAQSTSRFTIPVSIIVPVGRETTTLSRAIDRMLGFNYPELEVIVVTEGAAPALLEELTRDWQIEAREFFYRKTLPTADVRRIYRSARDPRLSIIDKKPAGYADALNCGVNVARYRYVAPIDPHISFEADALLTVMAAPLADPGRVLGASSHIEQAGSFDRLASARSLLESRLVWKSLRRTIGPHGAMSVWRRDAVIKAEGFSRRAADPDIDMMFRIQAASGASGHFHRGATIFGRRLATSAPATRRAAGVRQRAALGLLVKGVTDGPRAIGYRSLCWLLQTELLVPFAQAWIIAVAFVAAMLGWLSWTLLILVVLALMFGTAAVSAAGLLLRGALPDAPDERELTRLLLVAPFEFVIRRPAFAVARVIGARRRL